MKTRVSTRGRSTYNVRHSCSIGVASELALAKCSRYVQHRQHGTMCWRHLVDALKPGRPRRSITASGTARSRKPSDTRGPPHTCARTHCLHSQAGRKNQRWALAWVCHVHSCQRHTISMLDATTSASRIDHPSVAQALLNCRMQSMSTSTSGSAGRIKVAYHAVQRGRQGAAGCMLQGAPCKHRHLAAPRRHRPPAAVGGTHLLANDSVSRSPGCNGIVSTPRPPWDQSQMCSQSPRIQLGTSSQHSSASLKTR